uniref:Class I SAM-dependent methyltransferase n=1 Tax=Eiseniibacteriota bacterium TaxID=2212470 RepID=A0A832I1W0_UNCEI
MRRMIDLAERGLVPDALVRTGIRTLLVRHLEALGAGGPAARRAREEAVLERLAEGPVAVHTAEANAQHYEVPLAFFERILGPRLKYSSGHWPEGVGTLAAAEESMLALTCERAGIEDGMRILDLGCGWGALTLWLGERYPRARVLAVSNSASQRRFIAERAARAGLARVEVVTADVNDFAPPGAFDRVVSVEMFEHVRNQRELLRRVSAWLAPGGQLFLHVFAHRTTPYLFDTADEEAWMARTFFTGGIMPSHGMYERFQEHLALAESWWLPGTHYARTLEAWRVRLDAQRAPIARLLAPHAPGGTARRTVQRWRMFLMACAELFAFAGGGEWGLSHHRFVRR